MTNNPLVSIIIPYFDFSDYLLEAVNSAAAQDYAEVEIVVVDDCSPVRPAANILQGHLFPRLKIIRHDKNLGCATARNTGVKNSTGEFILPLDSDDTISPKFLSKTLPLLLKDSELDGVYTQMNIYGELNLIHIPDVTLLNVLTAQPGPPTFIYRRKTWEKVNGYRDGFYHADAAFWASILSAGSKVHRVEEPLFNYRRHKRNGSDEKLLEEVPALSREFRDFFIENLEEILATEEKKYWQLKQEYKVLQSGFRKLEHGYTEANTVLTELIESRKKSIPVRMANFTRNIIRDIFRNDSKVSRPSSIEETVS